MHSNASQENVPLKDYFLLVFVTAVPFWLLGGKKLPIPVNLPASALTAICPAIAASILSYNRNGFSGVRGLLEKAFDHRKVRNRIWYVPSLLLPPFIYVSSYAVMRLAGMPLPDPKIQLLAAPVFFLVYFITGIGEELGWTGVAVDPMQERWGALRAGVGLGVIWAIWHSLAFVQTGNTASWIAWQSFKTVAMRVVLVWIYNNTGKSVFAVILYHTTDNVSWSLFPNDGSHYDPFVTGLITALVAAIVTFGWGARTLARYRYA